MADEIPLSNDELTNQKLALVEQSLNALYQTMDKIQGEKNHVGILMLQWWLTSVDVIEFLVYVLLDF